MLSNDCKRNCYLAAALTGLVIGLLSMGRAGFFGGLALGVMVAVIVGAILVWGLCNGRGGKVEDAETLRPDLGRTDDAAAGVSPLAQRVEAQLVAGGAAVAGYAAGLAGKPGTAPLKPASDEVVEPAPASHSAPAPQPVTGGDDTIPTDSPRPVEMSETVAPGGMAVVQGNAPAPEAERVDAVQADALEPVAPAKKAKKPKKTKDDKPAKAEKLKADSAKSDKPKRKKAEKEAKPEKADKNSRVRKLEKALKAVKAEKPAKVGKTKGGGKSAKASRDALAAEVQPMPQAAVPVPETENRPDMTPATPQVGNTNTSDAKLRTGEAAPDDLKEIKGVGPALESLLHENGVTRFAQIAAWGDAEIDDFAAKIGRNGGRIRNDDWIGQARTLAQGGETEFSRRVDKGEVY